MVFTLATETTHLNTIHLLMNQLVVVVQRVKHYVKNVNVNGHIILVVVGIAKNHNKLYILIFCAN